MRIPSNDLVKLSIGAGHRRRLELADQLFYPVAIDLLRPGNPLSGGYVGNRGGRGVRLTDVGPGGNTGGMGADYSFLEGDPLTVVKTNTSDGVIFTLKNYNGKGVVTVEDSLAAPPEAGFNDYSSVPRYIIKADGGIYDLLELRGTDTNVTDPNAAGFNGPYQHWELAAEPPGDNSVNIGNPYPAPPAQPQPIGNSNPAGGDYFRYTPSIAPDAINESHYTRLVGHVSIRPKEGASSSVIQEQLTRTQTTIDTMSRLLRTLHDEAKGPFANLGLR